MPPLEISPDAENIRAASDAIAEGIRQARASAKEGDIVNAEVAGLLRLRIDASTREPGCDVAEILAARRDDNDLPPPPRPLVHDRLDWGSGSFMPWCVLRVLPLVPDELQFRFVGHDLVLVDIDASLVVDVLPDALPARGSWKGLRYAGTRDGNRGWRSRHGGSTRAASLPGASYANYAAPRHSFSNASRSISGAMRQMCPWPSSTRSIDPGTRAAMNRACTTDGTRWS